MDPDVRGDRPDSVAPSFLGSFRRPVSVSLPDPSPSILFPILTTRRLCLYVSILPGTPSWGSKISIPLPAGLSDPPGS